jgi:hypothetical protein
MRMTSPTPSISVPAGFAPAYAVGYSGLDGSLALASHAAPLPVAIAGPAPAPLVGEATASTIAGPFMASPGRTIIVTLAGEWSGTVRLLRSIDGGATQVPLRVGGAPWGEFTEPGCEQAWSETEDGATFYLDVAVASGTVSYRVSQ